MGRSCSGHTEARIWVCRARAHADRTETYGEVSDKRIIWSVLEIVVKKVTVEPRKSAEQGAFTHTQNLEALFHFQAEL